MDIPVMIQVVTFVFLLAGSGLWLTAHWKRSEKEVGDRLVSELRELSKIREEKIEQLEKRVYELEAEIIAIKNLKVQEIASAVAEYLFD